MASKDPLPANTPKDAVALLIADHKRVHGIFEEFKKFAESDADDYVEFKQELIKMACDELKIHATIEEEIFYPAVRRALPDEEDLLNEAEVEHAGAKNLIAQLDDADASDAMTCAKFTVLTEYIEHHVREEEDEMFPKVRKSGLDLESLGKKMAARKAELQKERPAFDHPSSDPMNPSLWDRMRSVTGSLGQRN
jgi:hemerythrin-like domain-containing protein